MNPFRGEREIEVGDKAYIARPDNQFAASVEEVLGCALPDKIGEIASLDRITLTMRQTAEIIRLGIRSGGANVPLAEIEKAWTGKIQKLAIIAKDLIASAYLNIYNEDLWSDFEEPAEKKPSGGDTGTDS